MSLSNEINDFFNKYGELFDMETIDYTRQIVEKIISSPTLEHFFNDNQITAKMLLNEITPISQYKFKKYGDVKLEVHELQSIFNVILFSNEIENLILEDIISFNSIGPMGEMFYISDEEGAEYLNTKFGTGIIPYEEFDFTVLDGDDSDDDNNDDEDYIDPNLGNFSLN